MFNTEDIIKELHMLSGTANLEGMSFFGVNTSKALGISIPSLRNLAKKYKKQHEIAIALWKTGIHEARILASMIADPKLTTPDLMQEWVKDFNSWDLCDQVCGNLFDRTPYAFDLAKEWAKRKEEFEKRAGFTMMATLAIHDKKAADEKFITFFPYIESEARDDRNFVKKAVNWALRQIGKRNSHLNIEAIELAEKIKTQPFTSARWIASDALRELKKDKLKQKGR